MDSPFMDAIAKLLAERGVLVLRFEFAYMHQRRETGTRRPPDRQPVLLETWRTAFAQAQLRYPDVQHWYIGGKSMGGRMATLVADELAVRGCICLGYPFHPPGKPDNLRIEHLFELATPLLIAQGTRDKLGARDEVASYQLPVSIAWVWLEDGDHDLKPRVRSGFSQADHLAQCANAIVEFML